MGITQFICCLPLPLISWTTEAGSFAMVVVHFGAEGVLLISGVASYAMEIHILHNCEIVSFVDLVIFWYNIVMISAVALFLILFVPVMSVATNSRWLYNLWVYLEWFWVFGFALHPLLHSIQLVHGSSAVERSDSDIFAAASLPVAILVSM